MNAIDPGTPLGLLVAERPARARVFESLGLDYCCGGARPLVDACVASGLALESVLEQLDRTDRSAQASHEIDWRIAPLSALTAHILDTHHVFLRRELPRLAAVLEKVTEVHGQNHAELFKLQRVLSGLTDEMYAHMSKEENVLFPMIARFEAGNDAAAAHCGSFVNPIRVMLMEHDAAAEALHALRRLSGGFAPPADACASYSSLLGGLHDLERDTHQHIHLENNILFPRVVDAEKSNLAGS